METAENVTRVRLVGGNLALDFVNTRTGPPLGDPDDDVLTGYLELVDWAEYAGGLGAVDAASSRRLARRDSRGAEKALADALRVRAYLDDVFRALVAHRDPTAAELSMLRADEADVLSRAALEPGSAFSWSWSGDNTLGRPLGPIVHAAVELLTAGDLERIKQCGGCRFIFVDESKNRSRRWCSMEDCGTTEKIRRYVAARRLRSAS